MFHFCIRIWHELSVYGSEPSKQTNINNFYLERFYPVSKFSSHFFNVCFYKIIISSIQCRNPLKQIFEFYGFVFVSLFQFDDYDHPDPTLSNSKHPRSRSLSFLTLKDPAESFRSQISKGWIHSTSITFDRDVIKTWNLLRR